MFTPWFTHTYTQICLTYTPTNAETISRIEFRRLYHFCVGCGVRSSRGSPGAWHSSIILARGLYFNCSFETICCVKVERAYPTSITSVTKFATAWMAWSLSASRTCYFDANFPSRSVVFSLPPKTYILNRFREARNSDYASR